MAALAFTYCVTAHKPTSVTHSVVGRFTGADDMNLILAKSTRVEIHLLTPDGLQTMLDVPIYGRITVLELFRPPGETKDLLFILTERHKFCVLEYSAGELVTRANGDAQDRLGRPSETGQIGVIDPESRMIALHMYDGALKIIPMDAKGALKEAFNVRLDELQVIDMKFLYGMARPTLAILYQDTKEARHIKTYEVTVRDKDILDGPWQQANLDIGASLIIPIAAPVGGVIVVGEQSVVYLDGKVLKATPIKQTIAKAYGRVDDDGTRHLLSDSSGAIYLLALVKDASGVQALKLDVLGTTSAAATLSYLDNNVVFVGSTWGDSQLIRLTPAPDEAGSFVEVLQSFPGLGPIVDFAVVDLDRQGQGQVVTCSGVLKDGSLRVVRNGVGINEQATVELPGLKGIWSLRSGSAESFDTFLVVTFISETRVLAINVEDELDETDVPGFDGTSQTLLCLNAVHDQFLQVTATELRLVSASTRQLVTAWKPQPGQAIVAASANAGQVLLGLSGGVLVYLELDAGQLREVTRQQMDHEVSCVDCTPLGDGAAGAALAAVGLWNNTVSLLSLPTLQAVTEETLAAEAIPRSVLLAMFDGGTYLLAGLGDGQLFSFVLDVGAGVLSDRKTLSLGSQPITLRPFRSRRATHVFASSDRPTVVYCSNKKLMYSNVNLREVNHMCSFNSESFPDSLAVASDSTLTIGTIDDIQKLHIRTVPLGEQPRRIAHQPATRTFAVCCFKLAGGMDGGGGGGEEGGTSVVRLLDDQTFDTVSAYSLDAYESVCSVASVSFGDDEKPFYVVGTAFAMPDEPEPTRGRILVFSVVAGKLHLSAEKATKGAVYNLNAFQGKLLAGVNNKVVLYNWKAGMDDESHELVHECSHAGHILALYVTVRGDFILVGDLMKSITLLIYKPEESVIEERSRDANSTWMTAVEMIDDEVFLGAENEHNLFVLKKNGDAATDEERQRLEIIGEYHLGEFVNRFRRGSLVMRMPDSELSKFPTTLFVTISGAIGVLASMPHEHYVLLQRLQNAMVATVRGVGGFSWSDWRNFGNERRSADVQNFIDGDLVETFLDLKRETMEEVANRVGVSVEVLTKRVEELSRLH